MHRHNVTMRELLDADTFRRLTQARDFIASHYDQRLTLPQIAGLCAYSPFHFQRLFARAFGETPHEFLTRCRLEAAQRKLRLGGDTVTDICFDIGYESLGSFSYAFARRIGCPPTEFRRVFSAPGLWELKSVPSCFRGW